MPSTLRTLIAALLLLPIRAVADSSVLVATIDSLLTDSIWQTAEVGIYIYDITADSALYAFNAHQRMRPASTEKVVTAVAALDNLGPDYVFATRFATTGTVTEGVLQGDLWLKGGMDPLLSSSHLQSLCTTLHSQGIDSIAGRLCFDVSMKDTLQYGWGWCWDDDNHVLTPLLLNRKPLMLKQLTASLREAGIQTKPNSSTPSLPSFAAMPKTAVPLVEASTKLTSVLQDMMKESDNLHAECMFYLLAARSGRPWASRKQAVGLIQNTFRRAGINPVSVQVADGSGLSLYNYQTPFTLARLLVFAAHNNVISQTLSAALPIAGVDGTLKTRMKGTAAEGNIRAKTGTLTGVTSLVGYATDAGQHLIAFSIIVNGLQKGAPGRTLQDNICVAIAQN